MNAYELADEFKNRDWDEVDCVLWCEKSANMLRQQADRIAHLEMLVANRNEIIDKLDLKPQTKPLSDEEIIEIGNSVVNLIDSNEGWVEFARAIEERHGIK